MIGVDKCVISSLQRSLRSCFSFLPWCRWRLRKTIPYMSKCLATLRLGTPKCTCHTNDSPMATRGSLPLLARRSPLRLPSVCLRMSLAGIKPLCAFPASATPLQPAESVLKMTRKALRKAPGSSETL